MSVSIMKALPEASESRHLLPVAVASLVITLVSAFAVDQMRALDLDIFERLMLAFGEQEAALHAVAQTAGGWFSLEGLLNLLGFLAVASAAAYIGLKLPVVPRAFATASLLGLSLLYQWNLWHLLHLQTHPTGYLMALALGAASGLYLRAREDRRKERESHYYELKVRNKELLDTRLALLKQDEMERRILAADLHDQVLNDLKQVVQKFENYVREPDGNTADTIRKLTNQVMSEIREVMDSLSPSVLEHLGLAAALEDCLRRGSDRGNFKVRFKSKVDSADLDRLSAVEQGLLYRLVQESITNICKHAGASTVRASMDNEENVLLIRISDDGKGIDPAKTRADSRGLKYMRYRADLIGATISWRPGDEGKGTTVEIRMPLRDHKLEEQEERTTEDGALAANP